MLPPPSPPRSSTKAFRSGHGARIRNRPSAAPPSRRRHRSYRCYVANLLFRLNGARLRPVLWQRQPLGHQLAALAEESLVEKVSI
jgi:hypothetical protein